MWWYVFIRYLFIRGSVVCVNAKLPQEDGYLYTRHVGLKKRASVAVSPSSHFQSCHVFKLPSAEHRKSSLVFRGRKGS